MNDQTPRKNDLALVVGCTGQWTNLNGAILNVVSDPFLGDYKVTGLIVKRLVVTVAQTLVDRYGRSPPHLNRIRVNLLIRIPPPDESQTLFADEPVERGVSV